MVEGTVEVNVNVVKIISIVHKVDKVKENTVFAFFVSFSVCLFSMSFESNATFNKKRPSQRLKQLSHFDRFFLLFLFVLPCSLLLFGTVAILSVVACFGVFFVFV